MRPAVALVLAAAIATAGCQALVGGGDRETLTPAPVPEATDTPASGVPVPVPGVSAGGVADVERLVESHEATLQHRSATITFVRSYRFPNGTVAREVTVTGRYADGWTRYRVTVRRDGLLVEERGTLVVAVDDRTRIITRYDADGTVQYRETSRLASLAVRSGRIAYVPERTLVRERHLASLFRSVSVSSARPVDGGRAYRLSAVDFDDPRELPAADAARVSSPAFRATVRADGFIRSYVLGYTVDTSRRFRVVEQVRYAAVGETTVEPPNASTPGATPGQSSVAPTSRETAAEMPSPSATESRTRTRTAG